MHKKILEMIESADPEDTDTLDEIDAWVWWASRQASTFNHGSTATNQ